MAIDQQIINWTLAVIFNRWPEDSIEPEWFDIIAATKGWLPLKVGQEMTVRTCGKMFVVKRVEEPEQGGDHAEEEENQEA